MGMDTAADAIVGQTPTEPQEKHVDTLHIDEFNKGDTISSISDIIEPHAANLDGFDPTVHAVNADGSPKRKANGDFARKRGRGGKAATPTQVESQAQMTSEQSAIVATNLFINAGVMMFGDEWKPESKEEPQALKHAFVCYFDAKGVPNLPPEIGLIFALGMYSLPRLAKPSIKDKLSHIWQKAKRWLKRGKD